ncbi:MAG: nicotinate-nucleotide adenylyltransferase [Acidimicrobiia bacterium]
MPAAERRRVGVLGGTFDPIHNGHLVAASDVRFALALDVVLLVVAHRPWQKQSRVLLDSRERLAMVEAAVEEVAGLEASAVDIERGGLTFTVDTLADLQDQMPDAELFLIVGADVAETLDTWERVEEVQSRCILAVVARPGSGVDATALAGWRWTAVEAPRLEISSSDIRLRVAEGRPIDFLTHPAVVRRIQERGLYAGPPTT